MKLKPTLPENTFILNEDSLPTSADADPWGKIMVFRKDVGWSIIQQTDAVQFLAMKHTHWTFTPSYPHD